MYCCSKLSPTYLQEMINAAQKEELHSVNVIRDTLKIFLRIDRIAAFTCIMENPVSSFDHVISCDLTNGTPVTGDT